MSDGSSIQWTDATVNPVPGCLRKSPGCGTHEGGCYAEKMAWRLSHNPATPQYQGTVRMTKGGPRWTGKVGWAPKELDKVRAWKKPRRIFVESMGDVFFENVPREHVDAIFATMEECPQHTFQVLTKRPDRMADYTAARYAGGAVPAHIWLGTSVERQEEADERIPHLLRCNAKVRWLSCEPLLGPVDLRSSLGGTRWMGGQRGCRGTHRGDGSPGCPREPHHHHDDLCLPGVAWVVVGGESGTKARSLNIAWVRAIVVQCREAAVAAFVKQIGARPEGDFGKVIVERRETKGGASRSVSVRRLVVLNADLPAEHRAGDKVLPFRPLDSHGGDPEEWAADLVVREFPR